MKIIATNTENNRPICYIRW